MVPGEENVLGIERRDMIYQPGFCLRPHIITRVARTALNLANQALENMGRRLAPFPNERQ